MADKELSVIQKEAANNPTVEDFQKAAMAPMMHPPAGDAVPAAGKHSSGPILAASNVVGVAMHNLEIHV